MSRFTERAPIIELLRNDGRNFEYTVRRADLQGSKRSRTQGGYGSFGRTTDTPSHYFLASWAGVMMTAGAVVTHAGPSRTTQCVEGHSVVTTFFNCTFLV